MKRCNEEQKAGLYIVKKSAMDQLQFKVIELVFHVRWFSYDWTT